MLCDVKKKILLHCCWEEKREEKGKICQDIHKVKPLGESCGQWLSCGLIHCFTTQIPRSLNSEILHAHWPELGVLLVPHVSTYHHGNTKVSCVPVGVAGERQKELRPEEVQDWDKEMGLRPREDGLYKKPGPSVSRSSTTSEKQVKPAIAQQTPNTKGRGKSLGQY